MASRLHTVFTFILGFALGMFCRTDIGNALVGCKYDGSEAPSSTAGSSPLGVIATAAATPASSTERVHAGPSYPLEPLHVPSSTDKVAFATMCIGQEMGATGADCRPSVCSAVAAAGPNATVVVMVNRLAASVVKAQLAGLRVFVVEVSSVNWDETNHRYPEPERLYTFMKLHVWRLVQFECIVWFDADVFFRRDPFAVISKYRSTPQKLVAYEYPGRHYFDDKRIPYINTGFMLLRPSLRDLEKLVGMWRSGSYLRLAKAISWAPTEQDLICNGVLGIFGGVVKFDPCVNFRSIAGRKEQHGCRQTDIILNHGDSKGKCEILNGQATITHVVVPLSSDGKEKRLVTPGELPFLRQPGASEKGRRRKK